MRRYSQAVPHTAAPQGFFGWRVVGAAFVIALFAWGIGFYGPPIFLGVLHATRGWPVSLLSAAITVHFLCGAAVVACLGTLHRHYGVAGVTGAGALLTVVGLLGWGYAREPWQLFLAMPFGGAGWAMTSGAALNAMVSPWFERRRPVALGMAFNGASLGGVVFSPLWVALIAVAGFDGAVLAVALAMVATIGSLAWLYLRQTPAALGVAPDGDTAPVALAGDPAPPVHAVALDAPRRDRRFYTLALGASLGLFAQVGLVAHLFSMLVPVLGSGAAGAAMGLATACAIGGRILLGRLMSPLMDRRKAAAVNLGLQALGSVVLLGAGSSGAGMVLGCCLFGMGLGNVTSLPPLIAQADFRPADVARVVAWVTAVGQAGYAFAPAAFGLLREWGAASGQGGLLLFLGAGLIQLAAAAVMLAGRARRADAVG
ncbi:MFS transporter [Bordetella sp. BOR01]|uniref:MFS transporter n=1 Tax=Bordetella sp. BOR01 TaxID=2854779 RepID=UPI001C470087|nr:MFS transporter [Bordetella sp. BOR01]MBV7482667.1 MFS transporter [Bordetella sp. BOR01]